MLKPGTVRCIDKQACVTDAAADLEQKTELDPNKMKCPCFFLLKNSV